MVRSPEDLDPWLDHYREETNRLDRPPGTITVMSGLPLHDREASLTALDEYQRRGVERFVCGVRYDDLDQYRAALDALAETGAARG